MIRLTRSRLAVCLCFVVVTGLVHAREARAQSAGATTAAIDGTVSDSSAAALPGVTITATSPTLQGSRASVTNADGAYRLPQLPPGEYRLVYEMPGFATIVREKQRVAVGFNATINVQMQISSVQETLTVTGESPVVDQKASRIVTNFDAEKLASLPNARDLWSIMAASPAVQLQRVDVGGSAAGTQTGYSAYDTKADQHRPMVEGMVMTEGTGAAGFYYDYGSFEEVSVGTGSHSAEMGWPGVVSAFVAKSGGNAYHGKVYADYQTEGVQSTNIDDNQLSRGIRGGGGLDARDTNRMNRYYDLNADAGGYIKKDKLWWYGSVRNQQIDVRYTNYPGRHLHHEAAQPVGEGHLHAEPQQQDRRLHAVGQEAAADAARYVSDRPDHGDSHDDGLDVESGILGRRLQVRVELGARRQGLSRTARGTVRVRLAESSQQRPRRRSRTPATTS